MKSEPSKQLLSNFAITLIAGAFLATTGFFGEKIIRKVNSSCNAIIRSSYWLQGIDLSLIEVNRPITKKDIDEIERYDPPIMSEGKDLFERRIKEAETMKGVSCLQKAKSLSEVDACENQ